MGSELFRSNGATLQRGIALPWLCSSALLLAFCSLVLSPCLRAARNETWVEVRSPNFTVIGNAGEKETRKIAGQFEQIREVFQNAFPKMRVDLGKPVIILAVKNED